MFARGCDGRTARCSRSTPAPTNAAASFHTSSSLLIIRRSSSLRRRPAPALRAASRTVPPAEGASSVWTKRSFPFFHPEQVRIGCGFARPPAFGPAPNVQNATTAPIVSSTTKCRFEMLTPAGTPARQSSPEGASRPRCGLRGLPHGVRSSFFSAEGVEVKRWRRTPARRGESRLAAGIVPPVLGRGVPHGVVDVGKPQ